MGYFFETDKGKKRQFLLNVVLLCENESNLEGCSFPHKGLLFRALSRIFSIFYSAKDNPFLILKHNPLLVLARIDETINFRIIIG
jgi:hypothetical protein